MSVETLGKALLKTLLCRHRVNKFGSKESGPACWPNLTTVPPGSQVYMNDNTSRPNFLLIINILSTFSKHTDDPSRNRCMTRDCRGREDLIKWFRFGKNLSFKPNIKWPRITGICNQFIRLGDFVEISDISETAPPIIATQFRKLLPPKKNGNNQSK